MRVGISLSKIPVFGQKARETLSQYIAKPPASLKKVIFEQYDGKVIYYSDYNNYFKRNMEVFKSHDLIAFVTQHIPGRDLHYVRCCGLYSSRCRGKWVDKHYVISLAPDGRTSIVSYHYQSRKVKMMKEESVKVVDVPRLKLLKFGTRN